MTNKQTVKKWVYNFNQLTELQNEVGNNPDILKGLLGGKGYNLAVMAGIPLPVPPGFTITTQACNFYSEKKHLPEDLWEQALEQLRQVEKETGKTFGRGNNPLLVSCRSGAKFSMPGMMDTILNIGMNNEIVQLMIKQTDNPIFVWNCYRRLIQMYGSVVLEINDELFENEIEAIKKKTGAKNDIELKADDWKNVSQKFLEIISQQGKAFPQDIYEQLQQATLAVFKSWDSDRAVVYRKAENIANDLGTAVNIVAMAFGNINDDCGTGVAFTRDPSTGANEFYGEFLINAQGEDVVAGIRNTQDISEMKKIWPEIYQQLIEIRDRLEKKYADMQDIEFTIENKKLWMLQTRTGKRTAAAAIKVAVEMVGQNLIDKKTAIKRVSPRQVDSMLHPQFSEKDKLAATQAGRFLANGVNASPGAAVGILIFDANKAEQIGSIKLSLNIQQALTELKNHLQVAGIEAEPAESMFNIKRSADGIVEKITPAIIMIRPETKPDDVNGMISSVGILTAKGGATSHAAVVSRGFGIPCVCGCEALNIDLTKRQVIIDDKIFIEGSLISLDGADGKIFSGELPTTKPNFSDQKDLQQLLNWADEICSQPNIRKNQSGLQVWTNADQPQDADIAKNFGAKGIGLCRTEHMFFDPNRLPIVRKMILANDDDRQKYLDQLLPLQQKDFAGLFKTMDGFPVVIRLLDPPMHEFLPAEQELIIEIEKLKNTESTIELAEKQKILEAVRRMHESNPMMGLRGIRLGLMIPELIIMQVKAIIQAAIELARENITVKPKIMIPLVSHVNELKETRETLEKTVQEILTENNAKIDYKFGTMIEIPRAALTADEIAGQAEFFSFGTNDLTQMTFGFSRDDAEKSFLLKYVERGILPVSPFQSLDIKGVGQLISMGVEKGRKARPELEIGICGEHGGDPDSITFCHQAGLNYVSCSPYRVPVARLAAAQAALTE